MENSRLSFLENPRIAKAYYQSHLSDLVRNGELHITEPQPTKPPTNDFWSLYDFGKAGYKVVYFKARKIAKKRKFKATEQRENENRFASSLSRTRSTIFEIATCNDFKHFCTFTQSKELRDRFDLGAFRKDFAQFVRNLNRSRDEKIKYLLIPEQHSDGAWHMHGLLLGLNNGDLQKNEHGYLDWVAYRKKFGFFSVSPIKNGEACAKYVTKYITKDLLKTNIENGQHCFFASQGLKRAEQIVKDERSPCFCSEWDFENDYVKVRWIGKDGVPNSGQ